MSTNEKKGVTVKIDAELHAEVKRYIEEHGITMGDFVTLAFQDELHPKLNIKEDKNMGNMRTLAFQVPEELFQQIKDYLQRNNMTQKDFVIGLIETEINRDLTQRAAQTAAEENADVSRDLREDSAEVGEQPEERERAAVSDGFDGEGEETENPDEDMDESEEQDEGMGMSMGM
ncbi:MAG: hypothetical protein NC299_15020 [Lachnospiraceae bacterium]|nr:hypothetical protein [Ruminococcus sp.]MCM1276648.1 hypothetical protein [Lachnospiraceae bacterium]